MLRKMKNKNQQEMPFRNCCVHSSLKKILGNNYVVCRAETGALVVFKSSSIF